MKYPLSPRDLSGFLMVKLGGRTVESEPCLNTDLQYDLQNLRGLKIKVRHPKLQLKFDKVYCLVCTWIPSPGYLPMACRKKKEAEHTCIGNKMRMKPSHPRMMEDLANYTSTLPAECMVNISQSSFHVLHYLIPKESLLPINKPDCAGPA